MIGQDGSCGILPFNLLTNVGRSFISGKKETLECDGTVFVEVNFKKKNLHYIG
jgi:hypothetical protein